MASYAHCAESGVYLSVRALRYIATHSNTDYLWFVSEDAVRRIPREEERPEPSAADGVDFHTAVIVAAPSGTTGEYGIKMGEFCFSIRAAAAKQYLPNLFALLQKQRSVPS